MFKQILLSAALVASVFASSDSLEQKIVNIAHRGASAYQPENTLASFSKAIEMGADMVELDVSLCKTKELVVIHDKDVYRTTGGQGYVKKMTLEQLKALDAGKGQKIPTLEEALDVIDRKAGIVIEIKNGGTSKPVYNVISKYVEKGWSYDDFIVASFSRHELKHVRKLSPDLRIGLFVNDIEDDDIYFAKKWNAYSINAYFESLDQDFVDLIHLQGIKVYAWTVNELEDIENMKKLGVDGIFSDHPDRLIRSIGVK